jgi:glutamate/tyrosine decarboxylase-like PLP-dependent enzyme
MRDVSVDVKARMEPADLDRLLQGALKEQKAVYAVVAIIGSTEHGAVDPLTEILNLRRKYEKEGLSFVVHCDAAWGGYFASILSEPERPADSLFAGRPEYVPTLALSNYTEQELRALRCADSITIDPHKYTGSSLLQM